MLEEAGELAQVAVLESEPTVVQTQACLSHREAQRPQETLISLPRRKKDCCCSWATEVPMETPDAQFTLTGQGATLRKLLLRGLGSWQR